MRIAIAIALAGMLFAQGGVARGDPAVPVRPRLVVFLVVDGLPQWQVTAYREQLAPDGLRRFLDRGAWFADAHYGHAVTETAPGHAVMLTGAYPRRTGIIANQWRELATGKLIYNTGDPGSTYLEHATREQEGTSPRNLKAETVGDVLRAADSRSKVVAISGKDRSAILTAGHRGTAYIFKAQTGRFDSATYYMKELPAWARQFNAAKPANAYFRREWKPLLGEGDYAGSVSDGQAWFAKNGRLPRKLGEGQDAPGPLFYSELLEFPQFDELCLDFARAAIAGEALGRDEAPDILVVSLSSHDSVNHGYGAESRISHDHVLHLDRMLERFFRDLDTTVGRDNYALVLTSDHGFMPSPEYSRTLGRDAGRVNSGQLLARLNAGLAPTFGEGRWVFAMSANAVLLNRALIAERKADMAALEDEVGKLLRADPNVEAAYTRREIEGGAVTGPYLAQIRKGWDRERSADVAVVLKPNWMFGSSTGYTTHGSPHAYDTHVPILFYGPHWVRAGRVNARVEVADIAPTLSRMLRIAAPSFSEGKPLPLEVPRP